MSSMKNLVYFLLIIGLLAAAPAAQYPPSGPEVTANPDSLLRAGMDEILSYLLLNRGDFRFRDDYLPRDSFRLPIVDNLMGRPLHMNDFADDCKAAFDSAFMSPGASLLFLAGAAGVRAYSNVLPSESGSYTEALRIGLQDILEDWTQSSREFFDGRLPADIRDRIVADYKHLILEDVAEKELTAEEQDSIGNVEEQFAIDFANQASTLTFPEIPMLIDVNILLERFRDSGLTDKGLRKAGRQQLLYSGTIEENGLPVVIGSYGPDVYRGEYGIIVDPGGNDSYFLSYDPEHPHPVIIADFEGDDVYRAETEYALACGAFGNSVLIDYEGDDIYRGGSFSLGAGYFGVGILWDKKGNDSYFGDTFTQGAGTLGLGLLIDGDGSDTYSGNLFCQGFGFVGGIGGIIDNSGNDSYVVQPKYGDYIRYDDHYESLSQGFGYGIRPWLSGGWGFLFDYGGNDVYVCDIFGQGASYWYSLGILYDRSGNDQYLSHQYTQGNGTHMSLGILRDDDGNDIYRAYGVSQGCGHDYGCGWLQDRGGDDLYATYDLGHGAGQANGVGIFTDLLGNDRYYPMLTRNTQGYGNPRRDYGSIGIFLDLDGEDRYDGNGSNSRFWTLPGSMWGGGLDREIPRPDTTEATE